MCTEYLEIPKCPKCGDVHRYKLEVNRSVIIQMLTMDAMRERPRSVNVMRLFTCPVKDEEFQARFVLKDTSFDRIKDVTVVGIANDDDED